jgi:hypothetical protein
LALEAEGWDKVWSKDEGGEWALEHIPGEHHRIVAQALSCYRAADAVTPEARRTHGHAWDESALRGFRDWVRARVDA